MGIIQHTHGTDNVLANTNLAMLTGNVGEPSTGVNPLRGQNNVQGACDMGALPNMYTGYQRVDDPTIRGKFMAVWGCSLAQEPGLTLTEIFQAAYEGKIKALYRVDKKEGEEFTLALFLLKKSFLRWLLLSNTPSQPSNPRQSTFGLRGHRSNHGHERSSHQSNSSATATNRSPPRRRSRFQEAAHTL